MKIYEQRNFINQDIIIMKLGRVPFNEFGE